MFMESKERNEVFFSASIFDELNVMNFGHEKCLPNHSFGPQIREYYILHYILAGKGRFERKEVTYSLKAGNFFLIKPNDLFAIYQADETNPWEYIWIGFEGTKAESIVRELGFYENNRVGLLHNREEAEEYIQTFIKKDFLNQTNSLKIQGDFFRLLSYFSIDNTVVSAEANRRNTKKYVDLFVMYVRNSYWHADLTVEEIADSIGVHPTYLTQLVKSELKQTSQDYLINYRLIKGKFLLENTDYTVAAVSQAVGYQNALSFSRAFKRMFGYSPEKIREKPS